MKREDSGLIDLMAIQREADEEAQKVRTLPLPTPVPSAPPPAYSMDIGSVGSIPDELANGGLRRYLPKTRRAQIISAAVGVAALLGVVLLIATSGSDEPPKVAAAVQPAPAPPPPAPMPPPPETATQPPPAPPPPTAGVATTPPAKGAKGKGTAHATPKPKAPAVKLMKVPSSGVPTK